MSKYYFVKEREEGNRFDCSAVMVEVDSGSLEDLLREFKGFLQASGFSIEGDLDVVPFPEDVKREVEEVVDEEDEED